MAIRKAIFWPRPKSRSLSASSDFRLFYEALILAKKRGSFNKNLLAEELSSRVKGLTFIDEISSTGLDRLINELKAFHWIEPFVNIEENIYKKNTFSLSSEGIKAIQIYETDQRKFLKLLLQKMQDEYTIPGWFVDRLWKLNPQGQGQIVIPAPIKDWSPVSKEWDKNEWNDELNSVTLESKRVIGRIAPGAFILQDTEWLKEVKEVWNRLSKSKKKSYKKKSSSESYSPRRRLTLAMREASVKMLFGNCLPGSEIKDFESSKPPLQPRSYMAWCPRLDELELIFYSDFNTKIPGRIIFPVSVFKNENPDSHKYEPISEINNLENNILLLHKPLWFQIKKDFNEMIYKESQKLYQKTKALYVSVQDVRDEVCRQLRISSTSFNEYLEKALLESLKSDSRYTISIETDVREDQRSGFQRLRKSVIINNKIISLIAITTK